MTASCRPNFAILSTDGYWFNDPGGKDLNNVAIGNQDNVDEEYSTRSTGAFDGNVLPGTTASDGAAGGAGTLADVAMYYYKTDLRTGASPYATNNVPTTNKDDNDTQHMVTFTVGLGLDGLLTYRSDYETASTGDFADIKAGTGGKNWPSPQGNTPSALDDLWHAAVNGKGRFFSAQNPVTLAAGINEVLNSVAQRVGAGAAAATSNLQPVAGDNFAFTAQYQPRSSGRRRQGAHHQPGRRRDLGAAAVVGAGAARPAHRLQPQDLHLRRQRHQSRGAGGGRQTAATATRTATACAASARSTPTAATIRPAPTAACSRRRRWTSSSTRSAGPTARSGRPAAGRPATRAATPPPRRAWSTSCAATSRTRRRSAAPRRRTCTATACTCWATSSTRSRPTCARPRSRTAPRPTRSTSSSATRPTDRGHAQGHGLRGGERRHAARHRDRPQQQPVLPDRHVSVPDDPSNDKFTGTLDTNPVTGEGSERWAYMPSIWCSRRSSGWPRPTTRPTTASSSTARRRSATCASGTPPARPAPRGQLAHHPGRRPEPGRRGYYALDVTDPDNPKGLWEVTSAAPARRCLTDAQANGGTFSEDCNIGVTFGNPIIVKRPEDGRWIVLVTSGYNNVSPGDGKGYLYLLDAQTGRILRRMTTGVGTSTPEPERPGAHQRLGGRRAQQQPGAGGVWRRPDGQPVALPARLG